MPGPDVVTSKRSSLSQERSRQTRRRLVRAALDLWTERGFERGIEETTAAEIAEAAGVSKATFYLHFARKEDILNEMALATAVSFGEVADDALADGLPMGRILDTLHSFLAERVEGTDRAAVARSLAEIKRRAILGTGHHDGGFADIYERVLEHGQECGQLAPRCDGHELSEMLEALTMDAMERWAKGTLTGLRDALTHRSNLILAGVEGLCHQAGDPEVARR